MDTAGYKSDLIRISWDFVFRYTAAEALYHTLLGKQVDGKQSTDFMCLCSELGLRAPIRQAHFVQFLQQGRKCTGIQVVQAPADSLHRRLLRRQVPHYPQQVLNRHIAEGHRLCVLPQLLTPPNLESNFTAELVSSGLHPPGASTVLTSAQGAAASSRGLAFVTCCHSFR